MTGNPVKKEHEKRIRAFVHALTAHDHGFGTALITGRVNQYYLTGTMQDGLLVLKRNGGAYYL
jgi:hypothetical protein